MSLLRTDIWKVGIIRAPMRKVVEAGRFDPFEVHWLEEEGDFRFLADPFGLWRDGALVILAEAYDYRTCKGVIEAFVLDNDFRILERRIVLEEPWHLSYPFLIEEDGEIWMLPEAHRSGRLTLYRAVDFPWKWERSADFSFPCAAIDASPVRIGAQWWMFYTPPFPKEGRQETLKIARADSLFGPWEDVSPLPARRDRRSARMGGTPLIFEDSLILPMQDCTQSYGGGLTLLQTPLPLSTSPVWETKASLAPLARWTPFIDGAHTLSQAGEVTLIDAKRMDKAPLRRLALEAGRAFRNAWAK
jgi:hypothetical protein